MRNRCKAIVLMSAVVFVCLIVLFSKYNSREYMEIFLDEKNMQIDLILPQDQKIVGWEKDGIIHYFIPTYVNTDLVKINDNVYKFMVNGENVTNIPYDDLCEITLVDNANTPLVTEQVCFHHSQNLYTMYIDMDEYQLDDINKDEFFSTSIKVVTPEGKLNYYGAEEGIKGRGNSTWRVEKKPYSLKLHQRSSLCNLNPSKSWTLLANIAEGTKLACKLMYDFSGDIGIGYKIDSEWVDLYVNGEYLGNYLLCEKMEIDENRLNITDLQKENDTLYNDSECEHYEDDYLKGYLANKNPDNITGGYLLEKDISGYYSSELCGFTTDRGDCFTINSPNNASIEEVEYIRGFVQKIDDLIVIADDSCFNYIDMNSFIKRYFVEELAFNSDTYVTSCYFYKMANEDILYAGPIWDYDGTFGESNGAYLQYDESVLHQLELTEPQNILDWDIRLAKNPEYREMMRQVYFEIYPQILELLNFKIDYYANKIRTSIVLDSIRWDYGNWEAGHYASYDNNIRYMKFFLKQRINMLNEQFGIDEKLVEESNGSYHKLICVYEDQIYEFDIKDGDIFKEADLPPYDNEKYSGWCYQRDELFFCEYLPIFEDVVLLPNRRG